MASIIIDNLKAKKGPGYFKLNNSILLDNEYKSKIKQCIEETILINDNANPNTKWELIKGAIRNESIKFCSYKKKKNKQRENDILQSIKTLEDKINKDDYNNEGITKELFQKQEERNEIRETTITGHILRSKAAKVEHDEKNTKYFANLEQKHAEKKTLSKLKIDNTIITGVQNTLTEEVKFYKSLYKKDSNLDEDIKNEFLKKQNKKIDDNSKETCEGLLSIYECELAVKEMCNNKSPGSDGLTVEFYKLFWNDIKLYLINSLNYSFQTGNLTTLQRQGIISLIPKPNKDLEELSNWRPITLLNIDYKIATKAISNRIKKVLPIIIDKEQTGFMKGRYIGENVRLILSIINFLETKQQPGLLFFADFQKAFDSLSHNFIIDCLNSFNFGPDLIKWIKVFYNDIFSNIINNGYMSDQFQIQKGVRQGCPLSSSLFIICLQVLTNYIKLNEDIKGIKVGDEEIKQSLYADDATFFNNGTQTSFENLIKNIQMFSKCSGLYLNIKKSIILRVGTLKNSNVKYSSEHNFTWTSESAMCVFSAWYNILQ